MTRAAPSVAASSAPLATRATNPPAAGRSAALASIHPLSSEPHGPPTTARPTGAGGFLCRWDNLIDHERDLGRHAEADKLQAIRAHSYIAARQLEPVYVDPVLLRLWNGRTHAEIMAAREQRLFGSARS